MFRMFRELFEVFAPFSKFSDLFGPVRTCSDALGCIRMRLEASESFRKKFEHFAFLNWSLVVSDVILQKNFFHSTMINSESE